MNTMLGISKNLDILLAHRFICTSLSTIQPLLQFAAEILAWLRDFSNAIMIAVSVPSKRHNKYSSCVRDPSYRMVLVTRIPYVGLIDRIWDSTLKSGERSHMLNTVDLQWLSDEYGEERARFLVPFIHARSRQDSCNYMGGITNASHWSGGLEGRI